MGIRHQSAQGFELGSSCQFYENELEKWPVIADKLLLTGL